MMQQSSKKHGRVQLCVTQLSYCFLLYLACPSQDLLKIQMIEMKNESQDDDDKVEQEELWRMKKTLPSVALFIPDIGVKSTAGMHHAPIHTMIGQALYAKNYSRETLTTHNRIGVCVIYNKVKCHRNLLLGYAIRSCDEVDCPLRSQFSKSDFTGRAMDNSDFADNSSVSGTLSSHYAASVVYQDIASLMCNEVSALQVEFNMFLSQCEEHSELCQYFAIFQYIVGIIKSMVTADREGNYALHVEDSMPLFHEFDALNYLRYGS